MTESPTLRYRLAEMSQAEMIVELVDVAPDTRRPEASSPTIRPARIKLMLMPDDVGHWSVRFAQVIGPKVQSKGKLTKLDYDVTFHGPLDEPPADSDVPLWVLGIVSEVVEQFNTEVPGKQLTGHEAGDRPYCPEDCPIHIPTPGCGCGRWGLPYRWHDKLCAWRRAVDGEAPEVIPAVAGQPFDVAAAAEELGIAEEHAEAFKVLVTALQSPDAREAVRAQAEMASWEASQSKKEG